MQCFPLGVEASTDDDEATSTDRNTATFVRTRKDISDSFLKRFSRRSCREIPSWKDDGAHAPLFTRFFHLWRWRRSEQKQISTLLDQSPRLTPLPAGWLESLEIRPTHPVTTPNRFAETSP